MIQKLVGREKEKGKIQSMRNQMRALQLSAMRWQLPALSGIWALLFSILLAPPIYAEYTFDFQGEITGWGSVTGEDLDNQELGARYIPSFRLALPFTQTMEFDSELSANLYGIRTSGDTKETDLSQDGKLYRSWARLFTDRLEVRLGLQEISFGPGRVLRSLRWFDQKDRRDPTGFTDGVRGGLMRYYFEDDSNIWFWTLYGNSEPMGISPFTSWPDEGEVGARIQIPLESGEAGVSFHYRNVDPNQLIGSGQLKIPKTPETRAGMDLTWDWGVGVWLEASYFLYKANEYLPESLIFGTIGGDYTFDLGNGLYTLIEIMGIGLEDIDRIYTNEPYWLMAFSQQYPINLVDDCRFFALYQPENEVTSLQVDWRRTYDDLILNAVLYYTHAPQSTSEAAVSAFAPSTASIDKGIKLVIQYNH
jgi:hypothetical protein